MLGDVPLVNWFPDSTVVNFDLFTCNDPNNLSHFCDPGFDAQTKKAHEMEQTDAAAAGEAWAKVDRKLVDEAPIAALVNQLENDVVSARGGQLPASPAVGNPPRPALGAIGSRTGSKAPPWGDGECIQSVPAGPSLNRLMCLTGVHPVDPRDALDA